MSSIVLLSYGRNAYDHAKDVEHDTYYGSFLNDPTRLAVYMNRAEQYMARGDTGWYSMIEVNTKTGDSKVWFLRENPLKTRVELNIPAKEAQAIKKVRKLATPINVDNFLEQLNAVDHPTPSMWASLTTTTTSYTLAGEPQPDSNADMEF